MKTVFPLMLMSAAEHGRAMVAINPAKNVRMRYSPRQAEKRAL
jgi:hypothetical protein